MLNEMLRKHIFLNMNVQLSQLMFILYVVICAGTFWACSDHALSMCTISMISTLIEYLQSTEILGLDVVHLLELEVGGVGVRWHGPADAEVVPAGVSRSLSGNVE